MRWNNIHFQPQKQISRVNATMQEVCLEENKNSILETKRKTQMKSYSCHSKYLQVCVVKIETIALSIQNKICQPEILLHHLQNDVYKYSNYFCSYITIHVCSHPDLQG